MSNVKGNSPREIPHSWQCTKPMLFFLLFSWIMCYFMYLLPLSHTIYGRDALWRLPLSGNRARAMHVLVDKVWWSSLKPPWNFQFNMSNNQVYIDDTLSSLISTSLISLLLLYPKTLGNGCFSIYISLLIVMFPIEGTLAQFVLVFGSCWLFSLCLFVHWYPRVASFSKNIHHLHVSPSR